MLSGSSFIHRLSQYSGLSPDKLDLFTDNKGLITRIHARRQYSKDHPNATLAPDWDLVEQIHRTMEDIKQQNKNFSPTKTITPYTPPYLSKQNLMSTPTQQPAPFTCMPNIREAKPLPFCPRPKPNYT
jgi:hypothetical protein